MMRTFTSLSVLLALAASPALAQTTGADWRPFRVGHTYTFEVNTAPVQLETVRLAAGRVVGADSVYDFASFYRPATSNEVYPPACPPSGYPIFRLERNTPFGAELLVPAQGHYQLRFTDSEAYTLPRRALAVGASWPFAPGITATVMLLEVQLVGTASIRDSVMTATLSGGGEVMLSKSFGLLNAPDLRTLSRASPLALHLLTIPERGLGGLPNDTPPDWQPGDSVVWHSTESSSAFLCGDNYDLKRYLTRTLSATGDTIVYTGVRQAMGSSTGAPGCGAPAGVFVGSLIAFREERLMSRPASYPGVLLRQATTQPREVNTEAYYLPVTATTCIGGWRYRYEGYLGVDSCRQTLDTAPDFGGWYETVSGFGTVRAVSVYSEGSIVWFRLNGQTCGSRPEALRLLLSTPKLLPAEAVQLFPNPAATAARLRLTGTKGGALTLTATDALGRRVWQQAQVVGPDTELVVPTAAWAPGVYYVRVALPEGARTLRLVRE